MQHLAQDQHRALPGGQVLEGGDEREADALPRRRHLGRVAIVGNDPGVGDLRDPFVLREHRTEQRKLGLARRPEVHRTRPSLASAQHVKAHVGGDAVEP